MGCSWKSAETNASTLDGIKATNDESCAGCDVNLDAAETQSPSIVRAKKPANICHFAPVDKRNNTAESG